MRVIFASAVLVALAGIAAGQATQASVPRVAFLGVWDRSGPILQQASEQAGLPIVTVRPEDLVADKPPEEAARTLNGIAVLYVLNVNADKIQSLQKVLEHAKKSNASLRIIALDRRDAHAGLIQAGLLEVSPEVRAYWHVNGLLNVRRLLTYTKAKYLGGSEPIEPPADMPEVGYYLPEMPDQILPDLAAVKQKPSWKAGAPVAAIVIHQSFWVTQDTKVINAEIDALRRRGLNVVSLFASTSQQLEKMLSELQPSLLIEDRHSAPAWSKTDGRSFLQQLDVLYLRPISMLGYTVEEWMKDPRGLANRDMNSFMSLQECAGTIEPIVVGGLKASIAGYRLHEPIGERIERFADRAAALVHLRTTPNAQKKVAIIYYNKSLGKDDLMRGSPTGAFLDGPESLMRFLPRMKERGYTLENTPKDAKELIARIQERGRNIGPWAQGEVDAQADKPGSVLIPLETYEKWFTTKLSEDLRKQVIDRHGPPPGRLMVVNRNGKPHILIPTLRMGNMLMTPQPERGEKQDEKLLHSRDVPPPHNYLAFYWWLQEEYHADVVVHWGTHGSLELLPGKDNGLCSQDWPDICVGTLPVVNLWIMDNIGESTLARRRSYAALVDHLVPPATSVSLVDEAGLLSEDIRKFETLPEGLVRQEFRRKITQASVAQRLPQTLNLTLGASGLLDDEQVKAVDEYLHLLSTAHTPTTMHILGQAPARDGLPNYLVKILRKSFLQKLSVQTPPPAAENGTQARRNAWLEKQAERFVKECVLSDQASPAALAADAAFAKEVAAHLAAAPAEIDNLLRALEGRFTPPGPGPDPIRNPSSVPPGRNLYALNPEEIPTRASWEVAVQLVDDLLRKGTPRKIGLDLSGMNTMRDYGVMEGQILYLMGVRPVWDVNNLAIDVELIPTAELKRPRVDVFIAMGGHYRENFGSRLKLLDKAVRLASGIDEPGNGVRTGSQELQQRLEKQGMPADKARQLSLARVFGTKPGNLSGTGILHLVPRSGVWESQDEITSVYIDHMSYVYSGDLWGQKIDGLYEQAIQGTDTIMRVWASNMTSELSNHHSYEYLGGMSMAVARLTGKQPHAMIADVRDPSGARVREFHEVLDTNLRTELLNPAWIKGMKQHGYAGAGHMAELTKNTFGWSVTRKGDVSDDVWREIYQTYVQDRHNLGLRQWFENNNPHALQEIAAVMLESSRKGYWNAEPGELQTLSELYADSVARHGLSSGLVSGGNEKLQKVVADRLAAAPGKEALAKAMAAEIAKSVGAAKPDGAAGKVYGAAMQPVPMSGQSAGAPAPGGVNHWPMLLGVGLGVCLGLLFLIGYLRRSGAAK